MSRRQKEWAKRARARLIERLGGRCRVCGFDDFLQFDCITPTGDRHHRMSTDQRMSYYHRQEALGNVQLLCPKCNAQKSDNTMTEWLGELFCKMLPPLPESQRLPF